MLWGGRFNEELDSNALKFSSSLNADINLIEEDIAGSKAHALMLAKVKLISKEEAKKITAGLDKILKEWKNRSWNPDPEKFEDIHSAIELKLFELIGDTAGKLHTGRSRNDQVATDLRLWIKKACGELTKLAENLQHVLLKIADKNTGTIIPGYTHLQRAQPISLAFHLLAYVEMLERDKKRFMFVKKSANSSPLGSGALAGSTLPLDRNFTSKQLGFETPTANALDSVSDRDFILDFLNACSIGMMHLSRLSEEIIIWSTAEWNFLKLGDAFTTGSSLMPQKKNPDLAELIRGKTGKVYGNYIALAAAMKSLPLSYNRDLQEDKEPMFDSYFTYGASLEIMSAMLSSAKFNKERFASELKNDFLLATDLADWLVLKSIPFREAHRIVGEIIKRLEAERKNFGSVSLEFLQSIHPAFDKTVLKCFEINSALKNKKTYGSPNPELAKKEIKEWLKKVR